jgi:hypothetical protein
VFWNAANLCARAAVALQVSTIAGAHPKLSKDVATLQQSDFVDVIVQYTPSIRRRMITRCPTRR